MHTRTSVAVTALVALTGCLTGCMGSPEPYTPYHPQRLRPWDGPGCEEPYHAYRREQGTRDPRPDPVKRAAEEEELKLTNVVPVEIERTDALIAQGRKAVGNILGSIPRQPWNAHKRDLTKVLGEAEASKHLPRDPVRPTSAAAPAAPEGEAEGEGETSEE